MDILSTDIELVTSLQADNIEAFDLIYERYSKRLYSFGLKYLKSNAEAEELVQSVFLKVWENRKILKKELSFKSYLFTIAYNDICKFFRKLHYQNQFIDEVQYENAQASSYAEESIDFKSVLGRVEKMIDTLPERQKIIFRKSRIEGLSTKEIAEELKLAPGTIDNYISEALKGLRDKIQKEDILLVLFTTLFIF